jgi:aminoglycoside phosphotransferase (APT) family kinase protein
METYNVGELDLAAVTAGLTRWMQQRWPARTGLAITSPGRNAVGNGRSAETLFVDTTWTTDGHHEESLVVRMPPAGGGLFPTYELDLQGQLMDTARSQGIPAPTVLAHEPDVRWVGAPFLVMERLHGRAPGDFLSRDDTAWLHDAPTASQAHLCESFVDTMARLHRIDWRGHDRGFATRPGGIGLAAEIDRWERFLAWATDGRPPAELTAAFDHCRATRPDPEPPLSLAWGDARFGNVLVDDDFDVAAVLDWEMAAICPGEMDLAWHLAFLDQFVGSGSLPPGLLGRDETIARYEQRLGRTVVDLPWFTLFARLRFGGLAASLARILRDKDTAAYEAFQDTTMRGVLDQIAQQVAERGAG